MNKFVALCCVVFAVACSAEVEDEADTSALEEGQTWIGEYGPKNGSLIPAMPGDSSFVVSNTCSSKDPKRLLVCFSALNAQCVSLGGAGLKSKYLGATDETGRVRVNGRCVVRASAE
jgi:hypothetical protein